MRTNTHKKLTPTKKQESISDLYETFLKVKKAQGIKKETLNSYSEALKAINKYKDIGELPLSKLDSKTYYLIINKMIEANLSPNSIHSYTATFRTFLRWCSDSGYQCISIVPYKKEEVVKTPYTDEELKLLLKKPNLKTCTFAEYRTWVIESLLINCGCRAATVRNFLVEDVDLDNKIIFARHMKNGRPQPLPLCSEMILILQEYLTYREGTDKDYLFPNETNEQMTVNGLRCSIQRYNLNRGVSKTSTHLFRHTFAKKYLIDCGGDAFTLQKILGHSTLDMTKHYCAIYNSDLTKDFDRLSPLSQMSSKRIKMR